MKRGKRIAAFKAGLRKRHTVATPGLELNGESREERVRRLYAGEGGPLVQWLLEEARRRGLELKVMARELGVTYGYFHQLRTGIRKPSQISKGFATAAAIFLGVSTATVLVVSGSLTVRDFAVRAQSDEEVVDRALRRMMDDPHLRASVPVDIGRLDVEGKKALALLYADCSGQDVFGVRKLPDTVRWLERAALEHEENEFSAAAGHRDTSLRLA